MVDTIQMNLRLPRELVEKIEFITQGLNVSRNAWIKVKLAEMIRQGIETEAFRAVVYAQDRYERMAIGDAEFKRLKRYEPTNKMKRKREQYKKLNEQLEKCSKDFARNYFDMLKENVKSNKKS